MSSLFLKIILQYNIQVFDEVIHITIWIILQQLQNKSYCNMNGRIYQIKNEKRLPFGNRSPRENICQISTIILYHILVYLSSLFTWFFPQVPLTDFSNHPLCRKCLPTHNHLQSKYYKDILSAFQSNHSYPYKVT